MTWFRVDDGFADHPKTLRASLAAIGLWVKAGAWCSKHLTNGEIPTAAVSALGGTPKLARELVGAGLWDAAADGYAFHEWGDHQPSRDQVLSKRAATKERVARSRGKPNPSCNAVTDAVINGSINGVSSTTPVPSRSEREEEGHSPPRRPLEISDEERAEAEARTNNPARQVTAHCAWRAWNLASQCAGSFDFSRHTFATQWQDIASACNRQSRPKLALDTLCAWLWTAPDGPVNRANKPVEASRMTPKRMADDLNSDLDRAYAWMVATTERAA